MQAWDVVTTCQGQIRTVGMGTVTGIDMAAAIAVMNIRDIASPVVLALVEEAANGIAEKINEKNGA